MIAAVTLAEPEMVTEYRDDAPPELNPILTKALAKNINARYQTMGSLLWTCEIWLRNNRDGRRCRLPM